MTVDISRVSMNPRIAGGVALLLVFLVSYSESVIELFNLWAGIEVTIYRYGFLVLACSAYLIYTKRELFQGAVLKPFYWAIVPAAILALTWFVSGLADIQTVQLAVLPLLIICLIAVGYGKTYARLSLIPVFILIFAVPMWWPLYPILKDATTLATELFLRFIEKPVFVEGYYLHLPGGSFFVDDGCAGLRFLLVTLILGFITIDLYALPLRKSLVLLGAGVGLALIANWIRVIIVVLIGDATQMESRLVSDHNDLGWVVYGVCVLLPLFVYISYMKVYPLELADGEKKSQSQAVSNTAIFIALGLSALIAVSGPSLNLLLNSQSGMLLDPSLPPASSGWNAVTLNTNLTSRTQWQPSYSDETERLNGRYVRGAEQIDLQVVHYAAQNETAELIKADNLLADGEIWEEVPGTVSTVTISPEQSDGLELNSIELSGPGNARLLVWYWYEVGSTSTASSYLAKLYQLASLTSGRRDANLVTVASVCGTSCSDRSEVLQEFLESHFLPLKSGLSRPAIQD